MAPGLAAKGARVAVLARDGERAPRVVDAACGRVDALINKLAWMPGRQPILEMEVSLLERVLPSNVIGSLLTTKHFAPLMIRGGGGRIIYFSIAAAVQSGPGGAPYGGSKAAVNILANVAHQELANNGIRTVAIAPGLTDTLGMREIVGEDHVGQVSASYPCGRVGQPEDIVALVTFLCSDAAADQPLTFPAQTFSNELAKLYSASPAMLPAAKTSMSVRPAAPA